MVRFDLPAKNPDDTECSKQPQCAYNFEVKVRQERNRRDHDDNKVENIERRSPEPPEPVTTHIQKQLEKENYCECYVQRLEYFQVHATHLKFYH